jgi:hypothetical protein
MFFFDEHGSTVGGDVASQSEFGHASQTHLSFEQSTRVLEASKSAAL